MGGRAPVVEQPGGGEDERPCAHVTDPSRLVRAIHQPSGDSPVADLGRDGLALHRPGFRRFDSGNVTNATDALLRARDEAYVSYEQDLVSAWRAKSRDTAPRTETDPADQLRELLLGHPGTDIERFVQQCEDNGDLDDRDLDALVRRFEAKLGSGYGDAQLRDHVSVEEIQRKHRKRMATLYDAYCSELESAWRGGKGGGQR
jgi:hypothetical protein